MSETVDPRQRFLFSTLPGLLSQAYDYVRSNPLQATADVAQAVTPGGALQEALAGSEQISRAALRGDIGGMVGGAGAMGAGLLGAIPLVGMAGRGVGSAMRAAREAPEPAAGRGVSELSNRMLEAPPPMVGREGGVTSETVKRFLEDRNIPYTIQNSSSFSDNFGPSASQYFRIATPEEIKTIRLSDHFYPSSSAVDLRYGAPLVQAENELAGLLNLSVSQEAKNFDKVIQAQRAEAELVEAQKRLANAPKPETLARQEAERAAYWERMRQAEIRNEEIKRLKEEKRVARKSKLTEAGLLGGAGAMGAGLLGAIPLVGALGRAGGTVARGVSEATPTARAVENLPSYRVMPEVNKPFDEWIDALYAPNVRGPGNIVRHPSIGYRGVSDAELQAAVKEGKFKPASGNDLFIEHDPERYVGGGAYGAKKGGAIVQFSTEGIPVREIDSYHVKGLKEKGVNEIPLSNVSNVWQWNPETKTHNLLSQEDLNTILKRFGLLGTVGAGAAMAGAQEMQQ